MTRNAVARWWLGITLAVVATMVCLPAMRAQQPEASVVSAWIPAPAAGATAVAAYVELKNPTMYDVYILSARATGTAGRVELRGGAAAGAEPATVKEFAVPAYGSTSADPASPHLMLLEVTRALAPGDVVELALKTDLSQELVVKAQVRVR